MWFFSVTKIGGSSLFKRVLSFAHNLVTGLTILIIVLPLWRKHKTVSFNERVPCISFGDNPLLNSGLYFSLNLAFRD